MHLIHFLFLSFFGLAAAIINPLAPAKVCVTILGPKVVKLVPTATSTYKNKYPVRSTKVSQKKVTVTPKPSTQSATTTVVTVVSTSLEPGTDVIEIAETEYETTTITADTVTRVSTVTTSTDTTILTTSTVAAPSGFRPIQDTLDGAQMGGDAGAPFKRDTATSNSEELVERQPAAPGKQNLYSDQFNKRPQRVDCVVTINIAIIIIITKTKPAVTITAPASTTTVTGTKIITSTSTIVPADITVITTSTTTSTIEETTTPEETITTTTTTTNTVEAPGATVHAICGSRNYVNGLANGGSFVGADSSPPTLSSFGAPAGSAYECCERCAAVPNCIGSVFLPIPAVCGFYSPASEGACSAENQCTGTLNWIQGDSPFAGIASNGNGLQFNQVRQVG